MLVAQKIRAYKENSAERVTYASLVGEIQSFYDKESGGKQPLLISEVWLRKFATQPEKMTPSGQKINLLYRFLDENGGWDQRTAALKEVGRINDSLYFGIHNFFDIPEKTTTNLIRRVPGIYRVYRPVLTHPNYYTVGAVRIEADNERGVIHFEEQQTIQELNGREGKRQRLEGYVFKKSNFISLYGTDTGKNVLHQTTFTSCQIEDDRYSVMFGGFFDTIGKQMYSGQVFMERIRNMPLDQSSFEGLASQACCLSQHEIPESIKAFFDGVSKSGAISIF